MKRAALAGSIRGKLLAGAMLASLVALLVAGASLFAYDLHTYRQAGAASLAVEAEVIGKASAAALQFDDRVIAAENLGVLRARPTIRVAALYGPRGGVFASYLREGVSNSEIPALPGADAVTVAGDRIHVFHRILVDREIVGTIHLAEDLQVGARIASYTAIAIVVVLMALAISAGVSAWVQKGITRPVAEIARLAGQVVERRDYTVRAQRTTDDEVGTLVDAFNEMLAEIQRRTSALEASAAEVQQLNLGLERRVAERTAQLEEANLQLRGANQAKSSFLSMMSHEIRTPMNGVLGMLELLSLTELDTQQRATLGVVRESGRSLLRIIDDILDFSKIEAGKLEVRPEVASLERVVRAVAAIYTGNASSKGLLLRWECDPRISPAVRVDPLRLQQILNNLVSNAIKFTLEGSVEIRARLQERREGVDVVAITVADTGVGIPPETQAALFQPFSQADSGVARRFGGTGLGLSIGQRLAHMMEGSISLTSEPGKGTVVTLTLPLPVADPALLSESDPSSIPPSEMVAPPAAEPPTVAEAEAQGRLVLVVDDHPINRQLLSRQVELLGYAHEAAGNGREAFGLWESGRFALVITDCNMPEMDGYELARAIRASERARGQGHTIVIACTANALAGEAENCLAAGMDDYIAKPVDLGRLGSKLSQWLPRRGSGEGASAAPMIDRSVLATITGDDAGLAHEVLREFARINQEDMAAAERASAAADLALVAATAHRIKGASRSVGAAAMGEASEALEAAARRGDWVELRARLADARREADRLSAHLADSSQAHAGLAQEARR
jgi:signal transduction histidine kinase/DNA-binding response OmpR family regulator